MKFPISLALLVSLSGGLTLDAVADENGDRGAPRVAPIDSTPLGQSYGRWAEAWWQWGLGAPVATNPILDVTGENCAQRQVDDVWFLAGAFTTDPVTRSCTIPKRKSLFFPLVSTFYGAFLNDPDRSEEFVRSQAQCTSATAFDVWIDGRRVEHPERYFTGKKGSRSPFFNVQLPSDNLFGADETVIPELLLSPSAEQGYYLFIGPLKSGEHLIHWTALGCGFSQDITYQLTVE